MTQNSARHKPATLVIGNRNYSSWSLRAWLALRFMNFDFRCERLPLDTLEFASRIGKISAAGCVPVLIDGETTIWDSLAICEYAAEGAVAGGWPEDRRLRAHARCAVAEMHSSFTAVRHAMPMNIRARRQIEPDSLTAKKIQHEVERITQLWSEALTLTNSESNWLYGTRSIADAFFAPVAFRFLTYGVALNDSCQKWVEQLMQDPDVSEWRGAALRETEVLSAEEVGIEI